MDFELVNSRLMLHYYINGLVVDVGEVSMDKPGYQDWLDYMVRTDPTVIFFMTVNTTDVFEKDWDFNEVAMAEVGYYYVHIKYEDVFGYDSPVYSWDCWLCQFRIPPDLIQPYVDNTVLEHLSSTHTIPAEIVRLIHESKEV